MNFWQIICLFDFITFVPKNKILILNDMFFHKVPKNIRVLLVYVIVDVYCFCQLFNKMLYCVSCDSLKEKTKELLLWCSG